MAEITLKYDAKNSIAKAIIDLIYNVGVFEVEKNEDECPYDKKFIAKIEKSRKEYKDGKYEILEVEDLWK